MFLGLPYSTWIAIALGVAGFVGQWMWRRRSWKWRHRIEKKLDARLPSERKRTVRFMPSAFINMLQSWVLPATKDEAVEGGGDGAWGRSAAEKAPETGSVGSPSSPWPAPGRPVPTSPSRHRHRAGPPFSRRSTGWGCNPRTSRGWWAGRRTPLGWWAGRTARATIPDTTRSRPKHYEGRGAAKRQTRLV